MFESGTGAAPEPAKPVEPNKRGWKAPQAEPDDPSEIERLAGLLDGESAARPMIELAWTNPHSLTVLRIAIAYQILFGDDSTEDSDRDSDGESD